MSLSVTDLERSLECYRDALDHLAFHVSDYNALRKWTSKLDDAGVPHSKVKTVEGWGWMIELRDPDDVQLELFTTRQG